MKVAKKKISPLFYINLCKYQQCLIFIIVFPGHHGGCGITEDISQWMESIQNSAVEEPEPYVPPPIPIARKDKNNIDNKDHVKTKELPKPNNNFIPEYPSEKYSRATNEVHKRQKRATRLREDRNTCSLYIQTDPLIWKHIREGFPEVRFFYCCNLFYFPAMFFCSLFPHPYTTD